LGKVGRVKTAFRSSVSSFPEKIFSVPFPREKRFYKEKPYLHYAFVWAKLVE